MSISVTTIELPPPAAGWFDLAYQALADGTLARFQADFDVRAEMRRRRSEAPPAGAQWPWPPFPHSARARIHVFDGIHEGPSMEFPSTAVFPVFDRLPDGRWAVADSRCRPGDLNAQVLAADGSVDHRFAVGDGVSHLQADAGGAIWVGYFDEGIFGAFADATTPPLGASGLNRFDAEGCLVWAHDPFAEGGSGRDIFDCEALNVFGHEAWCCADSPEGAERITRLTQFSGESERAWDTDFFLVQAIGVRGDSVAAVTHLLREPFKLTELRLTDGVPTVLQECALSDVGVDIADPDAVIGRGARLHLVESLRWHILEVQD